MLFTVYVLTLELEGGENEPRVHRTRAGAVDDLSEWIAGQWDDDDGEMPEDPEEAAKVIFGSSGRLSGDSYAITECDLRP
jgi:hypothetical protein